MTGGVAAQDLAGFGAGASGRREVLAETEAWPLDQNPLLASDPAVEEARQGAIPGLTQTGRPFLAQRPWHLRHARGRRAGPLGIGKDMQMGQVAVLDQSQGVGEHGLGLGRKSGDEVRPEDHVRAHAPHGGHQGQGIGA